MDAPGAQGCLQVTQCAHGPVSPKWTRVTDERLARASEFPVNGILRSKDVHMSEVSWGTRLRSGTPVVPSSECFSSEVQRRSRRMKVAIERCARSGGGSGAAAGGCGRPLLLLCRPELRGWPDSRVEAPNSGQSAVWHGA